MPCKAIQTFRVRKGCIFKCAWLPPTLVMAAGDIAARLLVFPVKNSDGAELANIFALSTVKDEVSDAVFVALSIWLCVGNSAILKVCACSPPLSPNVCPLPTCIGVLPRKSGRAKLTRPSPPNVVPNNENKAWF